MTSLTQLASTSSNGFRGAALAVAITVYVLVIILAVILYVAQWRMFEKAGEKGWKAIIPIYNYYTHFRIAGESGWWILALLVPFVNIYAIVLMALGTAKNFKKSTLFAVLGLLLFPSIGYIMIGFGKSTYNGEIHN